MEDRNLLQHNVITEAKYDMTSLEINLFMSLIGNVSPKLPETHTYKVYLSDLELLSSKRYNSTEVEQACEDLQGRTATIWNGKSFKKYNFVIDSEYSHENRTVKLSMHPDIRHWFINLKNNFTLFQLSYILKLKSKYSKRIYQMVCQYRSAGELELEVVSLKDRLGLLTKTRSGKVKDPYPNIAKFRDRVLDVAVKEINTTTDLKISYESIKTGKKITHIQFRIEGQSHQGAIPFQRTLPKPLPVSDIAEDQKSAPVGATRLECSPDAGVEEKLLSYRLAPWQVKKIIENFPDPEIHKILYQVQLLMSDKKTTNLGATTALKFTEVKDIGIYKKTKVAG